MKRDDRQPAKYTRCYVHGTADVALSAETIGAAFERVAACWPDRPALVARHQGVRWNYRELKAQVDALAAGLIARGLEVGDRLAVWSPNRWEWTVAQFAAARAGLVLVSLNPAYRLAEVEYALNKAGCAALIVAPAFKSSDYVAMIGALAPELASATPGALNAARLRHLRVVIALGEDTVPGMLAFDAVCAGADAASRQALDERTAALQFDAPSNILFTSGTTGQPKGATLSHHNLVNNARITGAGMGITEVDRVCIPVPLFHTFGMVIGNLIAMTSGAAMIYPGAAFDALAVLETVAEERCTTLYGVPTMYIAELDHPAFARFDLSSLRRGMMGGAPCPIEVMKRVVTDMHMRDITITYGMTETSPCSTQTAPDDPLERRVGSVGRVQPHVEIKIVDADGRIVAPGVAGEFCARGYHVMLGYWDDETATAAAIDEAGWMHSGDLVVMDEDGYFNVVGRLKDMVIRGGENIYPREIEEFLHTHPDVADVQVIGVPNETYGEEVCAWIVPRAGTAPDAEAIRAFCRGQIAHYKIPRFIRVVDGFPLTANGKVQKHVIRAQMIDELDLAVHETA